MVAGQLKNHLGGQSDQMVEEAQDEIITDHHIILRGGKEMRSFQVESSINTLTVNFPALICQRFPVFPWLSSAKFG